MPREQGESGEFVETLAPEDVLNVFDAVDGPVILSADVADHFGVTRETARRKLQQLSDRGKLDRRKVSRRVVYWRSDPAPHADPARAGDPSDTPETPDKETNAESEHTRDESTGVLDLGALSFDRDLTPARREHLQAWLRHAADREDGVSKSDFEDWWTDARASDTGYNAGSFWEAFAKAAMKESDRFVKPNTRTYRYDAGKA